jgi:hypothetical protein
MNRSSFVPNGRLIKNARDLKSDRGENPEYDRALVELVGTSLGVSMDDREYVEQMLGIIKPATFTWTLTAKVDTEAYDSNLELEAIPALVAALTAQVEDAAGVLSFTTKEEIT